MDNKSFQTAEIKDEKLFYEKIEEYINKDKSFNSDIHVHIGKNQTINISNIDFSIDFKRIIAYNDNEKCKMHLCFNDVKFCQDVKITNIKLTFKLETLNFQKVKFCKSFSIKESTLKELYIQDVTFIGNVGIKENGISKLTLRPYQIDAHIVVNNAGYANKKGYIEKPNPKKVYINNIEFEDPHICNAKIYFIGISHEAECDFANRNLENVIFQNCNFKKTRFLNSFLKEAKFFNCEFPIVDNKVTTGVLFNKSKSKEMVVFWVLLLLLLYYFLPQGYYGEEFLTMFSISIIMTMFVIIIGGLSESIENTIGMFLKKILKIDNMIGKHIGIYDEIKLKDNFNIYSDVDSERKFYEKHSSTFQNISDIYRDLKINYVNNGNSQQAGDFHYASNLLMMSIKAYFNQIILLLSYMFNGFGERPLKGFFMITFILSLILIIQQPNKDYISTSSTPDFLLQTAEDNNSVTIHNFSEFKLIYKPIKYSYDADNDYGYNANFSFNDKNRYIPYLKENNIGVKIYYALSHITTPLTMKNKEWFQHNGKSSHIISAIFSILIWLYFIGMMKAFFNRIKR